jgi:hypothetical protein
MQKRKASLTPNPNLSFYIVATVASVADPLSPPHFISKE